MPGFAVLARCCARFTCCVQFRACCCCCLGLGFVVGEAHITRLGGLPGAFHFPLLSIFHSEIGEGSLGGRRPLGCGTWLWNRRGRGACLCGEGRTALRCHLSAPEVCTRTSFKSLLRGAASICLRMHASERALTMHRGSRRP